LLATSKDAIHLERRGLKFHWMMWPAIRVGPYVLELLHRVARVIKDYCGVMNEARALLTSIVYRYSPRHPPHGVPMLRCDARGKGLP